MQTPRSILLCLGLLLGASAARAAPLEGFPLLDEQRMRPLLVVAEVAPGAHFAPFPECGNPDVICMDPPPFWFKARVLSTVLGEGVPAALRVATTSHYGMRGFGEDAGPDLLLLHTDGVHHRMPRYARARLFGNVNGELYLVTLREPELWWLPCSVTGLREPIVAGEFPELMADRNYRRDAEQYPALFQAGPTGPMPRFGIPVRRLAQHLEALAPSAEQMECTPQDG